MRIVASNLTTEGFSPFGEVFSPADTTARIDHAARLSNGRPHAAPNLFLARTTLVSLPHRIGRMEQHPHSSQSFLPFGSAPMLVVAALPGADGQPDLATLRAFFGRGTGFSYQAGVWHVGIASLDETVPVAGFMYEDGGPDDCVFADVDPITVTAA